MNSELGLCHMCDRDARLRMRAGLSVCGFGCLLETHADLEGVGVRELVAYVLFKTTMYGIVAAVVIASAILLLNS